MNRADIIDLEAIGKVTIKHIAARMCKEFYLDNQIGKDPTHPTTEQMLELLSKHLDHIYNKMKTPLEYDQSRFVKWIRANWAYAYKVLGAKDLAVYHGYSIKDISLTTTELTELVIVENTPRFIGCNQP